MQVLNEVQEQRVYTAFSQAIAALNSGLYQEGLATKWQLLETDPGALETHVIGDIADVYARYEPALTVCEDSAARSETVQAMLMEMLQIAKKAGVKEDLQMPLAECLYVQQLATCYAHMVYIDATEQDAELVDASELKDARHGTRRLLVDALRNYGNMSAEIADSLVERFEQDSCRIIAQLQQQGALGDIAEAEEVDTGWHENYQSLIAEIQDATQSARNQFRSMPAIATVHDRLEAAQDNCGVSQEELHAGIEYTQVQMFERGTVDPDEINAFIRETAPTLAQAVAKNPMITHDIIRVAGVEVMMQGITHCVIAQYCDRQDLKPRHTQDEKAMRTEFEGLLDGLGAGARERKLCVDRLVKAVHGATCHAMGLDEPNHYGRLN